MKQPTLIDGIVVAVLISLGALIASILLGGLVAFGLLFELLLYGTSLAYLLYLLKRSPARIGRVITIAAWLSLLKVFVTRIQLMATPG